MGPGNFTTVNQRIVGNIVLNGIGAPEGTNDSDYIAAEGIYLDENVHQVEIDGNTIANCSNYGIFIHNAREFTVTNNTSYNNRIQFSAIRDAEDAPIFGGLVTGNIFFSKEVDSQVAYFGTVANDIANMGSFNNNFYARPFDDYLTITTLINSALPTYVEQEYALSEWQIVSGHDPDSRTSPVTFPAYIIDSIDQVNKFGNGHFDADIEGVLCWSSDSSCSISWVEEESLDGGALQVSTSSMSRVIINIGEVESGKQYLLRFSAVAETTTRVEAFLRQADQPWVILSDVSKFDIGTERKDYELLFFSSDNENAATVEFYNQSEQALFWLDNVEIVEAEATITDPDDYIRFEYNPRMTDTTIFLDQAYIEMEKKRYSGGFVLGAFESVVLLGDTTQTDDGPQDYRDFYGTTAGCDVILHWVVTAEENFSYYELQWSADGSNFTTITQVVTADITTTQSFQYIHKKPGRINYYRLKKVRENGDFEYSMIILQVVKCTIIDGNWEIAPNPITVSNPELIIKYQAPPKKVLFVVVDQLGRVLKTREADSTDGWNTITWNLAGLPVGLYYIYYSDAVPRKAYLFSISDE